MGLPPLLQRVLGPVHCVHVRQLLPLLHLMQRSFILLWSYGHQDFKQVTQKLPPLFQRRGRADFPN